MLVSAGPPGTPAIFACKLSPCLAVAGILVTRCPGLSQLMKAALASDRASWSGNKFDKVTRYFTLQDIV